MIFEEKDKRGKTRIVCSAYWPDGSRFRRRYVSRDLSRKVLARIQESKVMGTWRELKQELCGGGPKDYTIKEFADVYYREHCLIRNRRPDFKKETLDVIKASIVAPVRLKEFRRSHAQQFQQQRSRSVAPATVNRGLAVLSNLLYFALEKEIIDIHPMSRFHKAPEVEAPLRVPETGEYQALIAAALAVDPVVGTYMAILGETGLRMSEGLRLRWENVRIPQRQLTISGSKSLKVRNVPLSARAIELFQSLTRFYDIGEVFVRPSTMKPLLAPRKTLYAARSIAKLPWVGFHSLRHYRGTQWAANGVDVRSIQEWLGHSEIETTMRYIHYVKSRESEMFNRAESRELAVIRGGAS